MIRNRKNKTYILKKLKEELWELCKQYVRLRDGNVCFTCGKKGLKGSNQHTGHCIPSCICNFELNYHPLNLAVQCYFCNIHAGGNGAIFLNKLINRYGMQIVDVLFRIKDLPSIKPTESEYKNQIIYYKQLIEDLK